MPDAATPDVTLDPAEIPELRNLADVRNTLGRISEDQGKLSSYMRGVSQAATSNAAEIKLVTSTIERMETAISAGSQAQVRASDILEARLEWDKKQAKAVAERKAAELDQLRAMQEDRFRAIKAVGAWFAENWWKAIAGLVLTIIALVHPSMLPAIWDAYVGGPTVEVTAPAPAPFIGESE